MADLTTRAIITAHDRLTGPLGAMASRVRAINSGLANSARSVETAGRRATGAVTAGGVFGLGFALSAAKDFEKRMFGIGVATIPDAMERGENAVKAARSAMGLARDGAIDLSKEIGQSMGAISEIMESGVKGGLPVDRVEDFSRAVALLRLTDPDASAENLASWGVAIDAIYEKAARASGVPWGAWFAEQADIAGVAAAQTQLSTGSFIEGMRQFQALYAKMGVPSTTSAALLASGVKSGSNAIEVGQTLKSNALRVLVPTLPNLRAWSAAGLNRSDYFVGEKFINDPMKIAGTIAQLSGNAISGKNKTNIQQVLLQAQRDGVTASDADLQEHLTRLIARGMGLNLGHEENRERISDMLGTAMFTGEEVDMDKLYRDLVGKKVDPAKIAQMFEGRRISTNMAIFGQIESGFYQALLDKFDASSGQTLGNTQKLFDESWFGRVSRMEAAVSRLNARMMTSPGITSFINSLSGMIERLDGISPRIIDLSGQAILLGLAAGPIARLAGGMIKLGKALKWAGGATVAVGAFFGRLLGGGFAAAGRAMGGLAMGLGALSMRGSKLSGLWGTLGRGAGVLARFATPLGWITTGAWAAYEAWQNWDAIKEYADGAIKTIAEFFGFKIEGSPLGDAFDWLSKKLDWIVEGALKAVEAMSSVFFWRNASGSAAEAGAGSGGDSEALPPIEIEQGPASVEMDKASASAMGAMIASAVKSALTGINITVNGAGAGAAVAAGHVSSAPAPRTQNGGQHNGGN